MFKVGNIENLVIISCIFISVALCQDRIIAANESFNEACNNLTVEDETIPEQLLIRMKDVNNISDLLRLFVVEQNFTSAIESDSTNGTGERRALSAAPAASVAQPANCQTEQHVIELAKPENGAMIYWPSCIRVRRCGGCCPSQMLACKPLQTSILNITVLQMQYSHQNPGSFENQGPRIFSIEQHDRCSCTCKEGPEDCDTDVQEYRAHECRCVCKDMEAATSCTGSNKIWDPKDCLCKCRNVRLCSSGRHFNMFTCRCEILRRSLAVESLNQHNSTILAQTASTT